MASRNIVLSGFMASGKTSVGQELSEITGLPLVDTDESIEAAEGRSITSLFEERGEAYFREKERQTVARAAAKDGQVIALGGGAVLDPDNVAALRRNGIIYHLEVEASEVWRRAGHDIGRPLLGHEQQMKALLASRETRYRQSADVVVETAGKSPAQIARFIATDFAAKEREREGRNADG